MTVTTSRRFNLLAHGDIVEQVFNEVAKRALIFYLTEISPKIFARMDWPRGISKAYARVKAKYGRPAIGDLILGGALVNEVVTEAPSNVTAKGGVATTKLEIDYAATHQYGDPRRNIKQRMFIRLEESRDEITQRIADDFAELMAK